MARMSNYSTQEVADLIGMPASRIRHYVRRRLVTPLRGLKGEYRFAFRDMVLLRTAKGLLNAKVSPRSLYRVLLKLRKELQEQGEEAPSLASVRIFADGGDLLMREGQQVWDIETGQGQLDFAAQKLADNVASLMEGAFKEGREIEELTGDEWYNLGLDLEEVDIGKAPEAYRRALLADPKHADARVNLGRLHQLQGDFKRAKKNYELALEAVHDHQLAHFNLGTIFDELDQWEPAAAHYRQAPNVPDAHFNLARICERAGDQVSALRHLRQHRQLLEKENASR